MACFTLKLDAPLLAKRETAIEKLKKALALGTVTVTIGATGGVTFKGWSDQDRQDIFDLCAYRKLANTPEMRKAIARAEVTSGRKVNERAIASGVHSHDGGRSWSKD